MLDREKSIFCRIFRELEDPRIDRKKLYPLEEIMLVALASTMAGGEGYADMEHYGIEKLDTLRTLLPFENGIASEDTFERVFKSISAKKFEKCFHEWRELIRNDNKETYISIDGKTLRRSGSKAQRPLHVLNAWATNDRLVIGCIPVAAKSNEINAIPEILSILSLENTIVSMDAMGCQTAIVQQIVEAKGDFVIALKGNQGSLHEDVALFFQEELNGQSNYKIKQHFSETEKNHARIERRIYGLCNDIAWLKKEHPEWLIEGIGYAELICTRNGKETRDIRFFITSLKDVEKFAKAVRSHWGIENSLHGILDITFREDNSRVRDRTAAANLAVVRRIAMNILEQDKTPKLSKRRKKLGVGWNDAYMKSLLTNYL